METKVLLVRDIGQSCGRIEDKLENSQVKLPSLRKIAKVLAPD